MAAFCLFDNLEVLDGAKLEDYKRQVRPVVEKYGGRYVVLGGKVDLMEGQWQPTFPVMIEFPSLDQYFSDERALFVDPDQHAKALFDLFNNTATSGHREIYEVIQ